MKNVNVSAAFGWLVIIIVVIIVVAFNVIKFIANLLGSSDSTGIRAFGAISIVAIIGLCLALIISLLKGFFK
jgi:hypothetical protein